MNIRMWRPLIALTALLFVSMQCAAADYDTSELRRLFGSSEKLTFDIDRQGETLLIEIP